MSGFPTSWINDKGQVWLNVGSGFYVEEGFVNLDNHVFMPLRKLGRIGELVVPRRYRSTVTNLLRANERAVFVRMDCRNPLALPSESVDHILCSHFLEHVYPDEADAVVKGFWRVLKVGGTLHLVVPDLEGLTRRYLAQAGGATAALSFMSELLSRRGRPSWRYRALEALGFEGLEHRWMYDRASLWETVKAAGFEADAGMKVPSIHVRQDDGESLHLFAVRRQKSPPGSGT